MANIYPLEGITVLDFSQILAGPFCTMYLADMGADVIKIEKPNGGDDTRRYGPPFINGESAAFLTLNRNKRSLSGSGHANLLHAAHIKSRPLLPARHRQPRGH